MTSNSNNAAEIRRVRKEMSERANHDVRKLMELLSPLRERYQGQMVNHGKKAEQTIPSEPRPQGS